MTEGMHAARYSPVLCCIALEGNPYSRLCNRLDPDLLGGAWLGNTWVEQVRASIACYNENLVVICSMRIHMQLLPSTGVSPKRDIESFSDDAHQPSRPWQEGLRVFLPSATCFHPLRASAGLGWPFWAALHVLAKTAVGSWQVCRCMVGPTSLENTLSHKCLLQQVTHAWAVGQQHMDARSPPEAFMPSSSMLLSPPSVNPKAVTFSQ